MPAVAFSIMPMNSGKDFKGRETDVPQPVMAAGPAGGNQGGDYIVHPINPNALRGDTSAKTPSRDAAGVMRLRDPGLGVGDDGDPADTLQAAGPGAVAFALRGREGGAMPEVEGDGDRIGALRAASGGSSRDYVAFAQNTRDEVREMPYVGALSADSGMKQTSYIRGGSAVRRLTPRECERLQGFPDDLTLIPTWAKGAPKADAEETARWILQGDAAWRFGTPEEKSAAWERGLKMARHPDGPRYKALGNSMAVPVMAWIGRRIAAVDALLIQSERTAA
jgi:site-specific DNA-cytosine methylase